MDVKCPMNQNVESSLIFFWDFFDFWMKLRICYSSQLQIYET